MSHWLKLALLAFVFLLLPAHVLADVPAYAVIKEKSYLKFIATQNGAAVEGKFNDFTADVHFDPEQLEQSSVTVEVATGSVTAANEDVGKYAKLPEWLSVDAFPKAVFACKKFIHLPKSYVYFADGTLTLRGKAVPIKLHFKITELDNKTLMAEGDAILHRKDFGIGQGEWAKDDVVKDDVRVEFRITAEKK